MKRSYYIVYYRDFRNTYNLFHAPANFKVPEHWERIHRKKAEHLAREGRGDPFASQWILPYDLGEEEDFYDHRRFVVDGVIVSRKEV